MASDAQPGSPKWWLSRLTDELVARTPDMQDCRDLVDGVHPLPYTTETSDKFKWMAGMSTTNLCGLAVEATAERMTVEGVRVGAEPDADEAAWDMWQRCDFDAGSQEAVTAALIYSRSFVSVAPPVGDAPARLAYEDPRQVVVAYSPEGERVAALKAFRDDWTGDTFGTLYVPGWVVKLTQHGSPKLGGQGARWLARDMGADSAVVRNPFGDEIPFFELQNKALGEVRSEVAALADPQALLNQAVFNAQAVAEFGAFRQKFGIGIEKVLGSDGRPISPYEAGITKMFTSDNPEARFGDFGSTDLAGYIGFAQEIAAHVSRLSRVPITYFLSNISNLGGDALALLISALVLKCQRRVKGYEPALEGAVRLGLKSMRDPRADTANIEIKWADMETRSMAQSADAAVKLTSGDDPVITPQTAQEKYLGMSQTERDRDDAWRQEGRATSNLTAVLSAAQADALPA